MTSSRKIEISKNLSPPENFDSISQFGEFFDKTISKVPGTPGN